MHNEGVENFADGGEDARWPTASALGDSDMASRKSTYNQRGAAVSEPGRHRRGGQYRGVVTFEGNRGDQTDSVDLGLRPDRHAALLGSTIDLISKSRVPRRENQLHTVEVTHIHLGLVGKSVIWRHDKEEILVEERLELKPGITVRQIDDSDVKATREEAFLK